MTSAAASSPCSTSPPRSARRWASSSGGSSASTSAGARCFGRRPAGALVRRTGRADRRARARPARPGERADRGHLLHRAGADRPHPAWGINTVGLAMMTFTVGGLSLWMPTYLERVHGMSTASAGPVFGAVTVLAGLCGTLLGGSLGDRLQARSAGGYFWLSGVGLVLSAPLIVLLTRMDHLVALFVVAFFAELLLFLNTGPLNAALVGCVPAWLRGTAFAVNIFCIHAFGDALSRTLIGYVSDRAKTAYLAGQEPTEAAVRSAEAAGLNLAIATTAIPVLLGDWSSCGARAGSPARRAA
ncbi:MFS transporter [Nannocystis pusilla]|uniref:MFS transporter n=1 Tax=Nannocystis pusilla TaxID=889268 RepID=UPI003B7EB441